MRGLALAASERAERDFKNVPNEYRLRMHWYVFGPAWTVAECRRELELMARANVGGVLLFPTYPIAIDDPAKNIHNQNFLSDEYFAVLREVAATAKRLGLTLDMVLGTGWPYGGPSVAVDDSAHSIRRTRIAVKGAQGIVMPRLELDEQRIAAFHVEGGKWVQVAAQGKIATKSETGEIQIFSSVPTRMQVKRAALGADGLVVDHYNSGALEKYLAAVGDKLVDSVPRGGIRSIFCDSLEVYRATWTGAYPDVFRRKRGYDLIPHLPALFDDAHPDARDLRCDFWRTLSDLAMEEFVEPLGRWAHRKGVTTQVEAYGTPPVSLASYRAVDVPTGEHYEWKEFSSSRWASSGGHLAGKRTILAEAWTWLGLPNRFADSLEDLKRCSDLHFLCGINALYGVTYAYSPLEAGSPGWVPYFGPAVNHTSPYWPYFGQLADYVNRATFVLHQGRPVADVAVYLGAEDAMAEAGTEQLLLNWAVRDRISSNGPPPEFSLKNALRYESDVVKTIITNGWNFDGVDAFTFRDMRVENGRLRMGDGDYALLVLPNLTGIDVESARKIAEFARQGGTVIATKRLPDRAYGLQDREKNAAEVRKLVAGIATTDERVGLLRALMAHPPDIAFKDASEHVAFVHRRAADRDYYFLANTSEQPQQLEGTFRVGQKQAEFWDLQSGKIAPAEFEHESAGTLVRFELGPFESRVIVFRDGGKPRVARKRAGDSPAPIDLSPVWKLRFDDASIAGITLEQLKSWTDLPAARYFSGKGIYECEFDAPARIGSGLGVRLDLGRVHETADVRINDKPAGVAWMRPYHVDVTGLLRPGKNRLRVDVTNLLINKILGMGPIDYSAVYAKYGKRFPPGDEWKDVKEPFISGLLGPVRLVFYTRERSRSK